MTITASGVDLFKGRALIDITQSTTSAAASVAWALRNTLGTRIVTIERIYLELFFEGTAAATRMGYEIIKGTGNTALSGGVAVTPSNKRTSQSAEAATVSARLLDTGLTVTGVAWGSSSAKIYGGRIPASTTIPLYKYTLDLKHDRTKEIELAGDEVLGIRLLNTAVANDRAVGFCEFSIKAA